MHHIATVARIYILISNAVSMFTTTFIQTVTKIHAMIFLYGYIRLWVVLFVVSRSNNNKKPTLLAGFYIETVFAVYYLVEIRNSEENT